MASTTYATLFEEVALVVYAGKEHVKVTNGGTAAGTIVVADHAFTSHSAYQYDGMGIYYLDGDLGNLAPQGEFRRVTAGGFTASSGTYAIAPDWSAAPASSDKVIFMHGGLSDLEFLDAINAVVTQHYWPRWLPIPNLCPDGDMDDSTLTESLTNWTDLGVGTITLTKDSTAATTLLQRAVKMATGSTDGAGMRSDAINVSESETLFVSVPVSVTAGTIEVELYDVGASAVISGTQNTSDDSNYSEIRFDYTVQPDVEQIYVQITQSGGTALTAYVGWVSVLSSRRAIYNLPSSVEDASYIDAIEYLPEGTAFENDSTHLFEYALRPWITGDDIRDFAGANPQRITVRWPSGLGPLFARFRGADDALTGTVLTIAADTTFANKKAVVYGAAAELLGRWAHKLTGRARGEKLQEAAKARRVYASVMSSLKMDRPTASFATRRVSVPSR